MTKSGPDDEASVAFELKDNGIEGKVKSRALSIFHRWLGSALAPGIARKNREAAREKLLGSLEQQALQQLGEDAIAKLRSTPEAVDAVLEAIAPPGTARKQDNLGAVLKKAGEDLRLNPPIAQQSEQGPDEITPEVADRLEHYASGASTDEVRERWGRVLAAEIRQPGTFSLKVLRIIDELDDTIPALFETFAANRIGTDYVPRALSGKLPYNNEIELVDAGLLHDPGQGEAFQFRYFVEGKVNLGEAWLLYGDGVCVSIPKDGDFTIVNTGGEAPIISTKDRKPAVPAYLLTPAGKAIVSILPPVDVSRNYLQALRSVVPTARLWHKQPSDTQWIERDILAPEPTDGGDVQE